MSEVIPSLEKLVERAREAFKKEFASEPQVAAFAPGRVNLIGEHTDYNDGFVLPMALPLGTVIVGTKISGEDSVVVTTSEDADDPKRVTIAMPNKRALICVCRPGKPKWANYIKGVIANYIGDTPAFLATIVSSVPAGGGLSSSASLEVAMYIFLDAINGKNACTVILTDKALACQKAEHDYVGMPCGIMDQFISMMGKEESALLIDCRSLTSRTIPFVDPNVVILITNSNVRHELTGSEYSTRRKQCQEAALLIKKLSLRDATMQDIKYIISINTNEDVIKRARHVVTEIKRTEEAAEALQVRNIQKFGNLMNESHASLRDDFEVSCKELDRLVELAQEMECVLGSRMTGGGFGGCTVTLVYKNDVNKVIENIAAKYEKKATFFICTASDGARIVNL